MANARGPSTPYNVQRWMIAAIIAGFLADGANAAPVSVTEAQERRLTVRTPAANPSVDKKSPTKRSVSIKTQKEPATDPSTSFTNIPLLIVYDPSVIGIGGPCPGDSNLSRAECALANKDFKSARAEFLESWNTQRSPFAAMRLGDLSLLEGEQETALDWYELVTGSVMIQKMTNLRRCEIEIGCGVTGRNLTKSDSFTGPFGNESLLRTARIYTRSGFPDLAATILIDGDGRGCDIAPDTCVKIAALALEKVATPATIALSLSTRKPGDGHDALRVSALRKIGMNTLADDLNVVLEGGKPAPRRTQKEIAAQEEREARLARRAAMRAEAEARRQAETAGTAADAKENGGKPAVATDGDEKKADAKAGGEKPAEATEGGAPKEPNAKQDGTTTAVKEGDAKAEAPGSTSEGKEGTEKAAEKTPKKTPKQQEIDRRTRRDAIDAGLKHADESIEKARRLMEVAGGALPLGGPE